MPEHDLVMLYSGGADSFLMLHWALQLGRKPYCILIDYGQKHVEELEYAKKQLIDLKVTYQYVAIKNLGVVSGLTGDNLPGMYNGVHPMNVPGRNTIFIGLAYSIAESNGIKEIWYGPDYSDYENAFPDCYQSYVGAMNKVLEIAPSYPIKLYAPLLGWTKEMILDYIQNVLKVDLNTLHSGYEAPKGN
jgi:7-cyano-7-deazaguanine synthase